MSYKTILVHVDGTRRSKERIELAGRLAIAMQAHLLGIADTGVSRFIYQDGNINGIDPGLLSHLNYLRDAAMKNIVEFKQQVDQLGVPSFEGEITPDDAAGGIALQASYCDLVVVGQTDPEETAPAVMHDLPEYMVLHAGRPVLIVPYAGQFGSVGKRPLVAWDGSRAATRAVTDALPFLREAEFTNVVLVNREGDRSGAELARYLTRHGVRLEITFHRSTLDVANALLSLAADLDSDLLVMGGYGHSRFREMIMGGTTRSILQSMTIPVLMSH